MTINTKLRLTILASALTLVAAAPVAIAQDSGTWYGNMHTDPVTAEGLVTRHSKALMEKKVAAPAAVAQDSGTWYGDIHTDPVTAEGLVVRHSRALMEKKIEPSQSAGSQVEKLIQLKDGSTVHVFADGKMAMEDGFGRASYMAPGHAMATRDGKTIVMNGNEVARLDQLLSNYRIGG
jgi:ketosteroid isomerase-like protein